jgi:hypothetical protein
MKGFLVQYVIVVGIGVVLASALGVDTTVAAAVGLGVYFLLQFAANQRASEFTKPPNPLESAGSGAEDSVNEKTP